jgi:hypothetical protein
LKHKLPLEVLDSLSASPYESDQPSPLQCLIYEGLAKMITAMTKKKEDYT